MELVEPFSSKGLKTTHCMYHRATSPVVGTEPHDMISKLALRNRLNLPESILTIGNHGSYRGATSSVSGEDDR